MKRFLLVSLTLMMTLATAEAAGYQVAEAINFFHLAKKDYDRGDTVMADSNLKLALQQYANFSEVYLLKGLLAYKAGQTDQADADFDRAKQLYPQLPAAERQALNVEVQNAQSGLSQKTEGSFQVQRHGTLDAVQVTVGLDDLQQAFDEFSKSFGFAPPAAVPVLVFSDAEFWDDWGIPWWPDHFFDQFDGKIRFRAGSLPGGPEELRRRLRAELTHVFLEALPGKPIPHWFQAALGAYEARFHPNDTTWIGARLSDLREATQGAPVRPLDRIEASYSDKGISDALRYISAIETEGLILNIIQKKGDGWILTLLQRLRRGDAFDGAFAQETGLSPEAALADWRAGRG